MNLDKLKKNELISMIKPMQDKLHTLEAALEAANAQLSALTTPPAKESIKATQTLFSCDAEGNVTEREVPHQRTCMKCHGTGEVQLPNGDMGKCYRCGGKGHMTARDVRRNDVYALHQNIAQMIAEGELNRYMSHEDIRALPARERAGKRIVEHNGWLVLL